MTETCNRPTPAELRANARASFDEKLKECIESVYGSLQSSAKAGRMDVSLSIVLDDEDDGSYYELVLDEFEKDGFTVDRKYRNISFEDER